ncbi:hypothetical protein RQP46_010064 [Phenoliferia psychrophenolica]
MSTFKPDRVTNAFDYRTPDSLGIPMYYSTSSSAFRAAKDGHYPVGLESVKSGPFARRPAGPYLKFMLHRSPLEQLITRWRRGDIKALMLEMGTPAASLSIEAAREMRAARSQDAWEQILAFRELVDEELIIADELSKWRDVQSRKGEGDFAVLVWDATNALLDEVIEFLECWDAVDERLAGELASSAPGPFSGFASTIGSFSGFTPLMKLASALVGQPSLASSGKSSATRFPPSLSQGNLVLNCRSRPTFATSLVAVAACRQL